MDALFKRAAALCGAALALPAAAAVLDIQALGVDGRALADAVVYLESPAALAALGPSVGVEVEQAARAYTQRVSVVARGSVLRLPNRDQVLHRVRASAPEQSFEIKLPPGAESSPLRLDRAGIVPLACAVHPAMRAWVVVVETPYHGLTGSDGRLRIAGVPPGRYRLRAWHPGLGAEAPARDEALVLADEGAALTLRLPSAAGP
ncbi:Protein containing plastocyanin/azurin family domain [Rubrivivax sp. A210]|uniref:carboxypeptidase regulatory-like domain-containing protein n=1 Tax=Rubrivivax sp. A210 TaxID=2772301 RepID=UPI0019193D68|nr:carboxypeptidase regulatory-like domain-containing protein [Rubrivivax sp. A210]CAD5373287.1 Protein containing plastocyanin/azurin family domain [Rubrivivax sp. A210]